MSGRQTLITPCKLNLHLGVHEGLDAEGYHRVDSVMVPVEPRDVVEVEDADALVVEHRPALAVPPERTTVWRAATLLAEELDRRPDVRVTVTCRIPERAGLGGSSADAAATLRLLAERWGADPLDPRVVAVARRVGADVPFFLDPRPSLLDGRGDHLVETFPPVVGLPVALVMPHTEGGLTAACYAEFDREPAPAASYDALVDALRVGDAQGAFDHLANNLAPAAVRLAPEVGEACRWLLAQDGVVAGQVTGSGACSFAFCEGDADAARIARAATARGWWAKAVFTVGAGAGFC